MTEKMNHRGILAAAMTLAALGTQAAPAHAVSLALEIACAADYYSYCSQHDPDGPGVRKCFRANGDKLSRRCLNALVTEGEISKSETESHTAKK